MMNQDGNGSFCCDTYVDYMDGNSFVQHDMTCENYDGAPIEQWEVTTPPDVYYTADYYGDGVYDSEIAYLNH